MRAQGGSSGETHFKYVAFSQSAPALLMLRACASFKPLRQVFFIANAAFALVVRSSESGHCAYLVIIVWRKAHQPAQVNLNLN